MTHLLLEEKKYISSILDELAKSIDLTETQYKDAISRYEVVSKFLVDPNGNLAPFNPSILTQGSFRIGTMVRPVKQDTEFDVDATCRLNVLLPTIQKNVKKLVGDRFKSDGTYSRMLDERKRCWRLQYAESSKFHLDIVPIVPVADYERLLQYRVPLDFLKHEGKITDIEHPFYNVNSSDWPRSNSEGYANWFLNVMKLQADTIRKALAESLSLSIERIPEYKVRTPLQRAIQLMKRHRDLIFENDPNELKPISIIITTLAAKAYIDVIKSSTSSDLFYDIITEVVRKMPDYIENRPDGKWVENPVNPTENFADKWQKNKNLETSFYNWHQSLMETLKHRQLNESVSKMSDVLKKSFGQSTFNEAFNNLGQGARLLREDQGLKVNSLGIIGSIGHTISNHTFHGQHKK